MCGRHAKHTFLSCKIRSHYVLYIVQCADTLLNYKYTIYNVTAKCDIVVRILLPHIYTHTPQYLIAKTIKQLYGSASYMARKCQQIQPNNQNMSNVP